MEQVERRGGLIVPVPEAEAVVRAWHERHGSTSDPGMPAHVTVLFPFLTLDQLDAAGLADLRAQFAGQPAFQLTFPDVGRFPGVVYLRPDPGQWFVSATQAVSARFGLKPYGGIYADIVPHLTVVQHADPAVLDEVDRALRSTLPLTTTVREVWLMEQTPGALWDRTATFALSE